jgi:hypothetical protein
MLKKVVVEQALRDLIETTEELKKIRTGNSDEYMQGKIDGMKEALTLVSKMPSIQSIKS